MVPYVSFSGHDIMLASVPLKLIKNVKKLGFKFNLFYGFIREKKSIEDEIFIFEELNKLGFYFSTDKEWSPAEKVEDYKEKGLLHGTYKIVSWNNGKVYEIREV